MITVSILINGNPIYTRTAVNIGSDPMGDWTNYKLDDKSIITHAPDDGAIVLAKKMLDTIHEVGAKPK